MTSELASFCFFVGPYHITVCAFYKYGLVVVLGFDAEISVEDYDRRIVEKSIISRDDSFWSMLTEKGLLDTGE